MGLARSLPGYLRRTGVVCESGRAGAAALPDVHEVGIVVSGWSADSPDLAAAKRLLDAAKRLGFSFQRVAPGPDGPLWGVRETLRWRDTLYLAGFSQACTATRSHKSSLIVPSGLLVTQRVDGDALSVLRTVVCHWDP